MKMIDLTGKTFGKLVVIERYPDYIQKNGRHRVRWKCKCTCGNIIVVNGDNLKSKSTTSCGCYQKEMAIISNTTHGDSNSRLYNVWCNMKERCNNKNNPQYRLYGGRGIFVCEEWDNNYSAFKEWALNNGYNQYSKRGDCTLDRINVNGEYSPNNCRWVSQKCQMNNVTYNHNVTYNGETHTIAEWADIYKIPQQKLRKRILRGIEFEKAILNKDLRKK